MKKNGISVVSLSVSIVVLLVIVSSISISITYSVSNAKKLTFAKEIYNIQSIVTEYIQKENVLPAKEAIQLEIKDTDFDSIINEVKTGKADFAAAGLSITEERLEEVDFSVEYAVSKQVIIVKNESEAESIEDFNGKKVAVQLGTIADLVLSDENPEIELVQHKKYLLAVEDLKADKVDAIVLDSLPAEEIVSKNPELKILEKELLTDKYGIAVQKGNTELLETINEVLQELMDNNKIEEYTVKYLGE